MRWNPYLNFDGHCRAAFEFYARCLGGQIQQIMTFGETPAAEHVPPEAHDRIMHARLTVGEQVLMGSDSHPGQPYEGVKGNSIALHLATPAECDRIFTALAENGTVLMPLMETFWAARFGMLTDQFGVPWLINCDRQ